MLAAGEAHVADFKDHFSQGAAEYAEFRPRYPGALFDWLASATARHDLAWDCATGNGQAARGLAEHYARVIATDASEKQLAHAAHHPRIEYRVAAAHESGLPASSVDVVTVAQALHWLPLPQFFAEAARVLAPGGLIAAWGYSLPSVSNAVLDGTLRRYHDEIVGPYWPPERRMVDTRYTTVPFPFAEIPPPSLALEQRMTRLALEGYLRTWSASRRYREARGDDPVDRIATALAAGWPNPREVRPVRWPLFVRAGRVVGHSDL
jgi:SAM-dependent methyltransferase